MSGNKFYSLLCGYPVSNNWKDVLSPINDVGTLLRVIWSYMWGLISGFSMIFSLVYMSVFMPVSPCFGYDSFVISFEIRKCETFSFIPFQDCFVCLNSVYILVWVVLFLQKQCCWDFNRNCIKSVDHLLSFPNCEHRMSFHFFFF